MMGKNMNKQKVGCREAWWQSIILEHQFEEENVHVQETTPILMVRSMQLPQILNSIPATISM